MTKRITSKMTGQKTRADYDDAVNRISTLSVSLRELEAKRDKAIQAVRDEHAPWIETLVQERDALMAVAEPYAADHRDELFAAGGKTASTALATYGFRLGNPTLKPLSRLWTWEKIRAAVKAAFGVRFIHVEETIDKDGIKAQFGDQPEALAKLGCRIDQSEVFWVEPIDQPQEGQ